MTTALRIAAWAALPLIASPTALAQKIRPQVVPGDGSPSAAVGVRDPYDSPEKELKRMMRGAEHHLDRAAKQLADGHLSPACRALASAKHLCITADLWSRWSDLAGKLQKIGAERFSAAEELYQRGEYLRAVEAYRQIAATFPLLPVGQAARQALIEARDDPEVQAAINEARAARLFDRLAAMLAPTTAPTTRPADNAARRRAVTAAAITALKDDAFRRAVDILEDIVRSFGGAPTADKAGAILRTILADAEAKARLDRLRRARRMEQALAKARMYHKAGLVAKAAEMYRQVIKDFPDTPQAAQAAGYLGTLDMASPSK